MDTSTIIVILVLSALSLGAIVWLEMTSRRTPPEEAPVTKANRSRDSNGMASASRSANRSERT